MSDHLKSAQHAIMVPPESAVEQPAQLRNIFRAATPARIGLERTGARLTTRDQLDFQLAHAQARDAVHAALDVRSLMEGLRQRGLPCLALKSAVCNGDDAAANRRTYLRRPDLGRRLHPDSAALLMQQECAPMPHHPERSTQGRGIKLVIADGLSALAVERHALPLLDEVLALLAPQRVDAPVCIATQARVAIGDEIGERLNAELSVVLIGERPGLSSPDSLGAYITWHPRRGRTDAERNCISNIRLEGLSYIEAAQRLVYFMHEARRLQLSGVGLKDAAPSLHG